MRDHVGIRRTTWGPSRERVVTTYRLHIYHRVFILGPESTGRKPGRNQVGTRQGPGKGQTGPSLIITM